MAFTLIDANGIPQTFASTTIEGVHYPSHQIYPQVAGGGLVPYRNLDLQPSGALIKTGAGQIYGWHCSNHNKGAWLYVKFYDKATVPAATDKPIITLGIPFGQSINFNSDLGIQYLNGLGIRGTVNMADNDATALIANDMLVDVYYI